MSATPIKMKTVSFQLPGSVQPRAATAPPKIRQATSSPSAAVSPSHQYSADRPNRPPPQQHRVALSPPTNSNNSNRGGGGGGGGGAGGGGSGENNGAPPARVISPQPDLIADILDTESPPTCSKTEKRVASSSYSPRAADENMAAMMEATPSGSRGMTSSSSSSPPVRSKAQHGGKSRAASASAILQGKLSKAKSIKHHHHHYHHHHHHHHNHHCSSTGGSSGSNTNNSNKIQSSQVTRVAHQLRDQNNSASLDHVRWMKCDVAKMREHLIKIEEEIKLGNRTKSLLDAKVLDLRKCLSVNQQSISSQQKKSYREGNIILKKLQEEAHVLSKSKRKLEQNLMQMKSHLWNIDSMRKTLKSKISILSRALELDAQRMKIYEGPVITRPETVSKRRHYATACPQPKNTTGDEAVAQLCCKVMEVIGASKLLRSETKSLIQAVYSNKAEAHEKITSAVARSVEEIKAHQNDLVLQKGRLKMQQNAVSQNKYMNEIALGMTLGPHSDNHRSVSEKVDRPLSRLRPGTAAAEIRATKDMANKITRQLSASSGQVSRLATSDSVLGKRIKDDAQDTFIDSRMLRSRRAFLADKR